MLVQASWWEGFVPAHWWVKLDLGSLVGRAVGGCGLRKTLGSLSVDKWSYSPTLFVVWPEASQHWSLQAVGWGQVLVLMSQAR